MKKINVFFVLILVAAMIGCGKKEETTTTKQENKSTGEIVSKTNEKSDPNVMSGIKLYKIASVSNSGEENMIPEFTWDENGKTASIKDYKGKVIFVNFWSTWCGPCKKEMPDLSAIATELKDKEFLMLGLNVFHQPGTQDVADYLKTNPVSYTIIDGNEAIVEAFKNASGNDLNAVPTTFIVDKEGKIVETIVGARNKETFMKTINKYL